MCTSLFSCICVYSDTTQKFYCTDKLRLKVPWKNLYGAPVVAEVDGLYVVVGPASGIGNLVRV